MNDDGPAEHDPHPDLTGVRSMADLEDRVRHLQIRAGTPNPGQVHRLSRGTYELSKSTAARWVKPWQGRTPRLEVVLGLVSAYGVPESDLAAWTAAYGRARDATPSPPPAVEVSGTGETPTRSPLLLLSAVATVLVLAFAGWAAVGRDGSGEPGPERTSTAAPVPQISLPGPLNASGLYAFKPPQSLNLPLITDWSIPQQPFDLDRFEPTRKPDAWDLSFECRPARCPTGPGRTYTILPVPGISFVAAVDGSAVDDPKPCITATYQRESVLLTTGQLYCVRTGNRLALVRAVDLPENAPADEVLIKTEIAVWSLGQPDLSD
ncbi:hypothetical protein [Kineosporia succinea]|uniref:Helix-turn-helix protein n=1 Tax=Kineosporia succinea TaxID=84632 RepID=A0ABT9PA42_9ACTN|nr:hypothetical protein [Kineosporia succinea]MDP9829566.1 hypothetical protein [Kineosporia succinea]